ncbi:nucleoside triphosphate pyrophosphohydrolase [Cohnella zeiphila]|uniref:Nucleoside triphosphate pyrophosphohydrolase n=1 Tax=Cohnella zeiphila TaxID=2761120 RepID=A0A7X0VXF0_9BACL|nr:nucleoside triphosphate pyrophosphohydrolase [Cohnella zeiphila]MBB6733372.1 nucleoside triphosphate pyrophosphohydrolase [Cohnella zeiphila]
MPHPITVVGLGSGGEDQLTLGILRALEQAGRRFVRTADHPAVADLARRGIVFESFDSVYEKFDDFAEVYEAIAAKLLEDAQDQPVVYAVPGHPMVAERTVQILREQAPSRGVDLRVLGGESFLDQTFLRLGFDPIEGFQLLDASGLKREHIQPRLHTIIGQVYDAYTASDVKLTLMAVYPDDYPVVVGQALGIPGDERIRTVPLHELDRLGEYGNLTLVYIPASDDSRLQRHSFERLHEIVSILRSPEGCPWDREQTHASIRKNFIEETYEAIEALDHDDPDGMKEEFGDVILQVLMHSQMEEEEGTFDVFDVLAELNDKLIFRHPHVFGGKDAANAEEALRNWEAMKAEEKERKGREKRPSQLDGIPKDLPALLQAYKLQKKAAAVGFDWPDLTGVMEKIEEELAELKEAIGGESLERQKEELGDLLFAVVNASRFIKADPEQSLAGTNRKFISRFHYIEEKLRINGRTFDETGLTEMEDWWQEAKRRP